ncbi:MAG: hypothetical protein AB7G87_00275 [Clostridia bacterium]
MILEWGSTIAYKCPVCGSIEFHNISLFDFSGKKEHTIECNCKRSFVKISIKKDGLCTLSVPCIACNVIHTYTVKFKELWLKRIMHFKCAKNKLELCYFGNDSAVRQAVDSYEMRMDKLMEDIGYDDNFANSAVMLRTIDKIHDVAERQNLFCQCGSQDIDLQILYDRVELMCNKCFTYEIIRACTNQDLKLTLQRNSIILSEDICQAVSCMISKESILHHVSKKNRHTSNMAGFEYNIKQHT